MALFIIDQSRPSVLRYRCDNCLIEGISNFQRAPDGFMLDTHEDPPRWVKHVCEVADDAPPPPKAKKAKGLTPAP
jgi:hypothetical protein